MNPMAADTFPFADWLRVVASRHDAEAACQADRHDRLGRTSFAAASRSCADAGRLAWLGRRLAAYCRELADEAEATGSATPDELDDARARWFDAEAEDRLRPDGLAPWDVPADYASQDQSCPRAPYPPAPRPSRSDDPIDVPF
jgi:hypothetical protein